MIKKIKQNLIWTEGLSTLIILIILILVSVITGSIIQVMFFSAFMIFSFYFFRNPERSLNIIDNNLNIISPADGKIIEISKSIGKFDGYDQKVSIFLSPFDVHVNWIPINGQIENIKYKTGKFEMAFTPKSSELNERNDIVIKNKANAKTILVRQIAGTVARRIVCWIKPNEQVKIGQKYGMIKFGSRVDILLDKNIILNVKLGDRVIGAQTIIGKWPC